MLLSLSGNSESRQTFAQLLFGRVIPNLEAHRPADRPRTTAVSSSSACCEFEALPHDGITDWAELEKPLFADVG